MRRTNEQSLIDSLKVISKNPGCSTTFLKNEGRHSYHHNLSLVEQLKTYRLIEEQSNTITPKGELFLMDLNKALSFNESITQSFLCTEEELYTKERENARKPPTLHHILLDLISGNNIRSGIIEELES